MRDAWPLGSPHPRNVHSAGTATIVREFGLPQLVVRGEVAEGVIAVGTRTGRPIAYLALTKKGTARLFTARTCEED